VSETTTYTSDGQIAQIAATTSGTILQSESFNADGSLQAQAFGDAASTGTVYGYDPNGALTSYSVARADGPWVAGVAAYSPPATGDPALIGDLTDLNILLDAVENPIGISDGSTASWPAGIQPLAQKYTYGDDYRLSSVATLSAVDAFANPYLYEQSIGSPLYPQPSTPSTGSRMRSQSLQYDWRGNVTSSTDDASDFFDRSLGTVTVPAGADRITQATVPGGASSLAPQYDAAGNVTQMTVTTPSSTPSEYTFTWDEVGRLASASRQDSSGQVSESFLYAAGGERVQSARVVNGGSPLYTLNVFGSMVLKDAPLVQGDYLDDVTTEQIYLAGGTARAFDDVQSGGAPGTMPQASTSATNAKTMHTFLSFGDSRGSGSFVVDKDSGELVERTTYLAYGALESDYRSPRWQHSREDVKFTGQWDNAEVGLDYFGARYYSPELGRFLSPDPLTIHGMGGDANPYEYAYGNPIRNVNPSGLNPEGPGDDGDNGDDGSNGSSGGGGGGSNSGGGDSASGGGGGNPNGAARTVGWAGAEADHEQYIAAKEQLQLASGPAPDPGVNLEDKAPLLAFILPLRSNDVRAYQPPPAGAPNGVAQLRQLNAGIPMGVAQFSRDIAPGTSWLNISGQVDGVAAGALGAAAPWRARRQRSLSLLSLFRGLVRPQRLSETHRPRLTPRRSPACRLTESQAMRSARAALIAENPDIVLLGDPDHGRDPPKTRVLAARLVVRVDKLRDLLDRYVLELDHLRRERLEEDFPF